MREFFEEIDDKSFYYYPGSLTTPSCAEIVEWIVYKTPLRISDKHYKFLKLHLGDSNRDTQPLNDRVVWEN